MHYALIIELSAETTWPRRALRALTDDLPSQISNFAGRVRAAHLHI